MWRLIASFLLVVASLGVWGSAFAQETSAAAAEAHWDASLAALRVRADAGDAEAMFELGMAYYNGRIIEFGVPKGMEWLEKAYSAGSASAARNLSIIYNGEGPVEADSKRAAILRNEARRRGDPILSSQFPVDMQDDKPAAVRLAAFRELEKVAERTGDRSVAFSIYSGYGDGEYGLSGTDRNQSMYWQLRYNWYDQAEIRRTGTSGKTQDAAFAYARKRLAEDASRWRKEAAAGNPLAEAELGAMMLRGFVVPQDVDGGLTLLQRAADAGHYPAIAYLGEIYAKGIVVPKDNAKARYWAGAIKDKFIRVGSVSIALDFYLRDFREGESEVAYFLPATMRVAPGLVSTVLASNHVGTPPARPIKLEPRVALVIGNGGYGQNIGDLRNPPHDARLMAQKLTAVGFDVELVVDGDQRSMKQAIRRLGQKLAEAGDTATGLFYYAGHGAQFEGVNYLIPVNAPIGSEADLDLEGVSANSVLSQLNSSGAKTSILILDACRNNPFFRTSRDGTRGLARIDATGGGAYIAYATAPGDTAADGAGANSPFTSALAKQLSVRGQPIETMFRQVRNDVLEATGGKQMPWGSSSLVSNFQFTP